MDLEMAMSYARHDAEKYAPWMRLAIAKLKVFWSDRVPTACVGADWVCFVNQKFFSELAEAERAGVLLHELGHVLMDHHARAETLGLTAEKAEADAREAEKLSDWFIACDYAWNDLLQTYAEKSGVKLLIDGALLAVKVGMPNGLSAEEYYRILRQKRQAQSKPASAPSSESDEGEGEGEGEGDEDEEEEGEEEGDEGEGEGKGEGRVHGQHDQHGSCERGQCGSGVGGKPSTGEAEARKEAGARVEAGRDGTKSLGRTRAEIDAIREYVAEQLAQDGYGRLPGEAAWLVGAAGRRQAADRVDWEAETRNVIRRGMDFVRGNAESNWARVGRRSASVAPWSVIPGKHSQSVFGAVVVDTSGSMSGVMVRACEVAAAALLGLSGENEEGARMWVVTADAAVQSMELVRSFGAAERARMVKGFGGTDFCPAFEALRTAKVKPQVVVYVTDGYGSFPAKPTWCHVVWLVLGNAEVPFGSCVRLPIT